MTMICKRQKIEIDRRLDQIKHHLYNKYIVRIYIEGGRHII